MNQIFASFVYFWTVIYPIGTVAVFIAVTRYFPDELKQQLALR